MPYFSIIIPVLNASKTIDACLSCIDQQTCKDYEVIIVDGLSKDNTIEKILQYCQSHNFVRFISEKDNGIYNAMNKGVAMSKGKYLYFLGSDDYFFSSNVLAEIYQTIQQHNLPDLIYGNVLLGDTCIIHNGEYTLSKLYYLNICHQSIFYSKNIFREREFDQVYPAFADWHFNFKCFSDKMIRVQYVSILVAKFGLGGSSGRISDPLLKNKREVFLPLAKHAKRRDYFLLRKNTVDISTLKGKVEHVFFYFLNVVFHLVDKK